MRAETQYARSGDVSIAYQTRGTGPVDLVLVSGWVSNVEYQWEQPDFAHFLERLASFSRLIACAIADSLRALGIDVRAGLHTAARRRSDNGVGIVP